MRLAQAIIAFTLFAPPAFAGPAQQPARGSTTTTENTTPVPDEGWPLPSLLRLGINHPFIGYANSVPTCDSGWVLGSISSRFSSGQGNAGRDLEISEFRSQREIAANNWGVNNIPRRVCEAKALFSDQQLRTVHYVIREGQGMVGMSYGVDWCVQGVDPFWVQTPDCRSLRN